jgi:branched-chain amino acid transport system permease protein
MAISFVGGAAIERVLIRPVERASPLVLVIVTIGMFLAINSIAQVQFGNDIKLLPRAYPNKTWLPGNVQISSDTLVLVGVLLTECLILYLLLNRTRIGLAFRAVASNPESSRLVGVPVGRMLMLGWAMAAAIGALAGALVVAPVGLQGASMREILVYAFASAALGGFDSPLGAVVAGLIVGVAGTMTTQYLHAVHDIELVVPFGLILVVLLVRPSGLFGSTRVERV